MVFDGFYRDFFLYGGLNGTRSRHMHRYLKFYQ